MAKIKKQKNISMILITIIIILIIAVVLIAGTGNKSICGDNKCDPGETCTSCSQDCGSCSTTTTVKITTALQTMTTISKCSSNSDCMWCGIDCVLKQPIICPMIAPPGGYSCECVNGVCTKIQVSTTTTIKISDSCTDTDGGLNYYVQGTVSGYHLGKPYSYTDFCTGDLLTEYYCLTYYGDRQFNCAYQGKKCIDGACV